MITLKQPLIDAVYYWTLGDSTYAFTCLAYYHTQRIDHKQPEPKAPIVDWANRLDGDDLYSNLLGKIAWTAACRREYMASLLQRGELKLWQQELEDSMPRPYQPL